MSVDYRLLHHFRVSQRREMASRGELTVLRSDEPDGTEAAGGKPGVGKPPVVAKRGLEKPGVEKNGVGEPGIERRAKADSSAARVPSPPLAEAPRTQVLTHLLNEDR